MESSKIKFITGQNFVTDWEFCQILPKVRPHYGTCKKVYYHWYEFYANVKVIHISEVVIITKFLHTSEQH
jgi:hypothetical protein